MPSEDQLKEDVVRVVSEMLAEWVAPGEGATYTELRVTLNDDKISTSLPRVLDELVDLGVLERGLHAVPICEDSHPERPTEEPLHLVEVYRPEVKAVNLQGSTRRG